MSSEPDWLTRLFEDCEREAVDYRDVKLLKRNGRTVVWNVCGMFGYTSHGVPGQACRLLERYLYTLLRSHGNISVNTEAQLAVIEALKPRFLLIITCCVQLAAKMNSSNSCNSALTIRITLLTRGASHTIEEIISTEAEIFKTLDFRIPSWTSVDIGELLASELKLPTEVIEAVALFVDLAEYYQRDIEEKVLWVADMAHITQNVTCIRTLHLTAGAVAAAVRISPFQIDPAPNLAQLLRIPHSYLKCLRDVILKILLSNQNEYFKTLKRKLSSS